MSYHDVVLLCAIITAISSCRVCQEVERMNGHLDRAEHELKQGCRCTTTQKPAESGPL